MKTLALETVLEDPTGLTPERGDWPKADEASRPQCNPPRMAIAVRAWNEEKVIRRTLESLFAQSLFEELHRRGETCEVICIPNGCTDRTAEIAARVFAREEGAHPYADAFTCRVAEIEQAGRNHTWNAFVHSLSGRDVEFLFTMDSDILFNRRDTLFNMYATLLNNPEADIASDRAIKDITSNTRNPSSIGFPWRPSK